METIKKWKCTCGKKAEEFSLCNECEAKNKLTAFLEEEREKFNLQFCENYDWWITDEEPEAKPSLVKLWLS